MELRALRHAVALADELNFARAAARVHLTQSALSRSILTLEAELEARLFDRDLRHVALTPLGRQFIERARGLLFEAGSLKREVDLLRAGEMGDVAFGAGPFPAASLLPPVLAEMTRSYPRVRVQVEVNNSSHLTARLLEEGIEFFVADLRSVPRHPRLALRPFARQSGGLFCRAAHPLAGRRMHEAAEILRYPLLSAQLPEAVSAQVAAYLGLAPGALPLNLVCDSPALLAQVALETDAVLMSTHAALRTELAAGSLVALRLPQANLPGAEIGIVSLAGRSASPPAQWLIEHMNLQANHLKIGAAATPPNQESRPATKRARAAASPAARQPARSARRNPRAQA